MSEQNGTIYGYGVVSTFELPERMQFQKRPDLEEILQRFQTKVRGERKTDSREMYEAVVSFLEMVKEKRGRVERVISSSQPQITVSFTSKEVANLFVEKRLVEPERIIVMTSIPMARLFDLRCESFKEAICKFSDLRALSNDYSNKLMFGKAETLLKYLKERGAAFESISMRGSQLFITASFKSLEDIDIFEKTYQGVVANTKIKKD